MSFFNNIINSGKDAKRQFVLVLIVILCFMALGQVFVALTIDDFKKEMLNHDYNIAGYLYNKGFTASEITIAFTEQKHQEDYMSGEQLLKKAAYTVDTPARFSPEMNGWRKNHIIKVLIATSLISLLVLLLIVIFLSRLNQKFDKANEIIKKFMDGDTYLRLDDSDEGNISKLFSSINMMATSLTAHIDKEKRNRQFLKETISDISHQLKTPLAALQMYNEIIEEEKCENEVVNKFTQKSRNELLRIETLIKKLLKLARLDAGTIELEKSRQDLNRLLQESIAVFKTRAELEGKEIGIYCENVSLVCDKEWLTEAVSNLVKNSLDHTSTGSRISVECEETPLLINISVKDNGSGIHPDDINHIFKRFYRSRYSKDKQGIGIGLTLTRAIIEKHGGTIIAESEPGKGTVFQITFPKLTNL